MNDGVTEMLNVLALYSRLRIHQRACSKDRYVNLCRGMGYNTDIASGSGRVDDPGSTSILTTGSADAFSGGAFSVDALPKLAVTILGKVLPGVGGGSMGDFGRFSVADLAFPVLLAIWWLVDDGTPFV